APDTQVVEYDAKATAPSSDPTRTGYTFVGWNTSNTGLGQMWLFAVNTMPDNDVVLYAIWGINSYELSFNLNGGTGTTPDPQTIVFETKATAPTTSDPTRTGHTFAGWNTNDNGSGTTWDFSTNTMPDNNVILYAKWNKISYNLSFDLNGGTGTTPDPQTVEFEAKATAPTNNPSLTGHTFAGWNTSDDGLGTMWNFSTSTMPANDVVLYATWSKSSYSLSFNLNGGTGTIPDPQTIVYEAKATAPTVPTRIGYSFMEWNTSADGQGTTWDFDNSTMPANNVVLYAIWSRNTYTLSFDLNGASGTIPPSQSLPYESKATAPNNPTRTGYTFKGWNTNANGQGKMWNFTSDTMPGSNLVLYAIWNEITTKTPSVPPQGNITKTGNTLDYKVIAGFIVSLTMIVALVPKAIRNK
ncbi:MAG: InlB B-repeat-containing protein, partial [Bacilli bacterium]